MRKPNFFIIGAPKCGTSALAQYLSRHPQVLMHPGEPHFYSPDIDLGPKHRPVPAEYFGFFRNALPSQTRLGEKSVFYLASRLAPLRIIEEQPDAQFIVIVRNPIAMAYSWYAHMLRETTESCPEFERAWRLQQSRKIGRELPRGCKEPWRLQYGEICMVGSHLSRWLTLVSRDRIKVVIFDDLAANPREVYLELLAFLDLPPDTQSNFPIENEGAALRSFRAQRLLMKAARLATSLKSATGVRREFGIGAALFSMNAAPKPAALLSTKFHSELKRFFRDDVETLTQITGRDLSSWLEPNNHSAATESRPSEDKSPCSNASRVGAEA